MGTPEAALVLVRLLSQGIDTRHCLDINANKDVVEAEMRRLLVDPNVGVRPIFFAAYTKLLSRGDKKPGEIMAVPPAVMNDVRDTLFASLPKKTPEAMIPSLETVLVNPMMGYWVVQGSAYDLHSPYSTEVIAVAAANFDRLSDETQDALLDTYWDYVRSPLMLPVVRRKAEAGDGHALLRWLELEPSAATAFMRKEVVRPAAALLVAVSKTARQVTPGTGAADRREFCGAQCPVRYLGLSDTLGNLAASLYNARYAAYCSSVYR